MLLLFYYYYMTICDNNNGDDDGNDDDGNDDDGGMQKDTGWGNCCNDDRKWRADMDHIFVFIKGWDALRATSRITVPVVEKPPLGPWDCWTVMGEVNLAVRQLSLICCLQHLQGRS